MNIPFVPWILWDLWELVSLRFPREEVTIFPLLHRSQQDKTHHFPLGRDSHAAVQTFWGTRGVSVIWRCKNRVTCGSFKEIWDIWHLYKISTWNSHFKLQTYTKNMPLDKKIEDVTQVITEGCLATALDPLICQCHQDLSTPYLNKKDTYPIEVVFWAIQIFRLSIYELRTKFGTWHP